MTYRICTIEGDGVGHEVVPAALEVMEATGVPVEFVLFGTIMNNMDAEGSYGVFSIEITENHSWATRRCE